MLIIISNAFSRPTMNRRLLKIEIQKEMAVFKL